MKVIFYVVVASGYLLAEATGYTRCSYSYYDSFHQRRTHYYTCYSREYCCGTRSCCVATYARWYLWFVLAMGFLIVFFIWWYYRYRYRPRRAIVANTATVQTIQTADPTVDTTVYPAAQVNMGTPATVQYAAYPTQAYNQPPPPYSVATAPVYK